MTRNPRAIGFSTLSRNSRGRRPGGWWWPATRWMRPPVVHRREIAQTLRELATLEAVRVVVRPTVRAGNRYRPGALLPSLGVRSPDSEALVDLDSDRYFDEAGLRLHVRRS